RGSRARILSSTVQSSNPAFIPCPKKGTMACAASPTSSEVPRAQGLHFTVIMRPSGASVSRAPRSGKSARTSGKCCPKKASAGAEGDRSADLAFAPRSLAAHLREVTIGIEGDEPLLELDAHPSGRLRLGDEEAIQLATRHGIDELAIVAAVAEEV